ncbi:hypothetical protein C0Q70_13598 [Pomacea canaliculata]|uniref:Uncharacterized protein n=1 Tax=Pomacea canaliculata TaxID=400727 RepID=A0A2T7NXR0_POMCA|nr:hypothetical protein C0Q70_13598 [Pomacea canaliculata]
MLMNKREKERERDKKKRKGETGRKKKREEVYQSIIVVSPFTLCWKEKLSPGQLCAHLFSLVSIFSSIIDVARSTHCTEVNGEVGYVTRV